MGRAKVSDKDKSKMRPVSLTEQEFYSIKSFGSGSFTKGVKELLEIGEMLSEVSEDRTKIKFELFKILTKKAA